MAIVGLQGRSSLRLQGLRLQAQKEEVWKDVELVHEE